MTNTNNEDRISELNGEKLSKYERNLLKEMIMSNLAEYMMKSDYQNCCYSAMKAF